MWIKSTRRGRRWWPVVGPFLLSLPLAVSVEVPADSVVTQLRVSGGAGSYLSVVRDCEGDVVSESKVGFVDVGVSFERISGKWGMGVQGGYLNDDRRVADDYPPTDETGGYPPTAADEGYFFLSPQVQFHSQWVGSTLGVLYTTKPLPSDDADVTEGDGGAHLYPTVSVRVGPAARFYGSLHFLSVYPPYSGGDYVTAGLGGRPTSWWELWAGVGAGGLYSNGGVVIQMDFALNRRLRLGFNGRYGDESNYGLGVSLGARWSGSR
jgi:hypothetical protein